jgi:hypothetical protein
MQCKLVARPIPPRVGEGRATSLLFRFGGPCYGTRLLSSKSNPVSGVAGAFGRHLFWSIDRRVLVKSRPAAFAVSGGANRRIDRAVALQNFSGYRRLSVRYAGRNESAAATNAFRVNIGVSLGYAGMGKRTNQAASSAPNNCTSRSANSGGNEPARRNHWAHTGYRHQSETGQKPSDPADDRSDAGPFSSVLSRAGGMGFGVPAIRIV